ncbi:MAG: InlB B-repeat-containing protein, partial [Planctomycetota bacterium]
GPVLSVSSTSGGSVTDPGEGSFQYDDGTVVSIRAAAANNYYFVNWTGTAVSAGKVANPNDAVTTVTVDSGYTLRANFATTDLYTLTVSATDGGSVTRSPDHASYNYGDTVTLQAVADAGYAFTGWSGDLSGSSNPVTVVMDSDKSVTAGFTAHTHTPQALPISVGDSWHYFKGTSEPPANWNDPGFNDGAWLEGPTGIGYSDDVTYPTVINDMAGGGYASVYFRRTFDIADLSSIAGLELGLQYDDGFIAYINGQEIARSSNMTQSFYAHNDYIGSGHDELEPEAVFAVDTSSLVSGENVIAIQIHNTRSTSSDACIVPRLVEVSATDTYTLDISAVNGSVTRTPDKTTYNSGDAVTLHAVADTGYEFTGWSGDLSGSTNPVTIVMDSDKSVAANFDYVVQTYTISASAGSGGSISPSGTVTVNDGADQSFAITADSGYSVSNVVVDGSSVGSVTGYMFTNVAADHTIAASFAINSYSLTTAAVNGSIVRSPDQTSYNHGDTVMLQAVADDGYTFTGWSGDVSGSANPVSIVMDSDKSVSAGFAVDQYALTISSSGGGSVTGPGEGSFQYDNGTNVPIQATADNGQHFTSWTGTAVNAGKVANPNAAGTTVMVDASYTLRANFSQQDADAPTVTGLSPADGSIQAPLNCLIVLHITDAGAGVDAETVEITLDGDVIYTGDTADYSSAAGICRRVGDPADYTYAYQSDQLFDYDQITTVTVNAADLASNVMDEQSYAFRTEMRSFGQNKQVDSGLRLDSDEAATVCDSRGNIWVVWHAGRRIGRRDIYVGKLAAGADVFETSVRLTSDKADQANPAIALGADDRLYVVWQDNRRGNWDIYGMTSADGTNWSVEQRIADSDDEQNYNQVNPAMVVDSSSAGDRAYVVWQDDRAGNHDIYLAKSGDGFVTNAVTQVTSNSADQTSPAVAVDSFGTVHVIWADGRNPSNGTDIYGASSGTWTNVPVVRKAADQSGPVVAAERGSSMLHILWVDQSSGDSDIYYGSSAGLPGSPLTGINLIDDSLGAEQLSPTVAVIGTGSDAKVFACWRDERNLSTGGDMDLYMVQTNSGSGTNVFVGDGGANSDQTGPATGIDQYGHPYVVWTDDRARRTHIYYAGSACTEPDALVSGLITASSGGTVGTADLQSITSVDDVSVAVPAEACPYDVTVSITKVVNPHDFTQPFLNGYEFSPRGPEFSSPVTMTIPYAVSGISGTPTAYWYNPVTGTLSQQEMDNIEVIELTSSLHALRFTTTRLALYYAVLE